MQRPSGTVTAAEVVELTLEQIRAHDDQRDMSEAGYAALATAYRKAFAGTTRLLDVGGGSGAAVAALASASPVVVVVDWSFTMLAAAERLRSLPLCWRHEAASVPRRRLRRGPRRVCHPERPEWRQAIAECVRVCSQGGPVVVAWGGPPADDRLAGIERAYFSAVGEAAGVRAQRTGISLEAASACFASLGAPLSRRFVVEGVQPRSPRQVVERAALNPYRSQPNEAARAAAVASALAWAESNVGLVDEPVDFRIVRSHHVYGDSR